MTILEELEKFLITEVGADTDRKSLSPDEDLLDQRLLDSLGIMKLVVFLEKTYDIDVADEDIVPENFQNLGIMTKFVESKIKNRSS